MKKLLLLFVTLNLAQYLPAQNAKTGSEKSRTIDSLQNLLSMARHDTVKINILNDLSYHLWRKGNYEQAIQHSKDVLTLCDKLLQSDNKRSIINHKKVTAYSHLTIIYKNKGDYAQALEFCLKGLKVIEELGDKNRMASLYGNIGNIYQNTGNNDKALEFYFKGLKEAEELGDKNTMASFYTNIGNIHHNKGDHDKALEFYFKSLKIKEEVGNKKGMAFSYNNIGLIYASKGDYDKALEFYFKSLKIKEKIMDKNGMVSSYINIGTLYTSQKNFTEARDYLNKGLALSKEIGTKGWTKNAYSGLSRLDSTLGNWKEAYEYHKLLSKVKDSIFNEESSMQITEISTKYETEKKEKEIELLTKDKVLQQSLLMQQLLFGKQKENEIDILNKNKEIQQLDLLQRESDLKRQKLETEAKAKEVTLLNKDKEIKEAIHEAALQQQKTQRNGFIAGFALMLALAGVSYRSYRNKRKAHEIIAHQKELVENKQKEILDSINYAKRIQAAVLPPSRIIKEYLPDSFVLYKPKDIVAGDFYWMEKKEDVILFAAADCTGHGVPGAMVSVICNNALNRSVREYGLTNPGNILDKTREIVIQEFEKSDEEVKDGMDISLCSLSVNQIIWAGANNPLWLLRKNKITEYKPDKQPIGKFVENTPFTTHAIDLQKGDTIYIFTDGYADQFGGPKGKKFMYKQLKQLLLSIQGRSMQDQESVLIDTINAWKGDAEQVDDICIIGIRV